MTQSTAWKALERRICRMWGGERSGPRGQDCSDCLGGAELPVSVEITRSKNRRVRHDKIKQAKRHGELEGKPWVLVVAGHNDRTPIAVCDHGWLVAVAKQAGLIDVVELKVAA